MEDSLTLGPRPDLIPVFNDARVVSVNTVKLPDVSKYNVGLSVTLADGTRKGARGYDIASATSVMMEWLNGH